MVIRLRYEMTLKEPVSLPATAGRSEQGSLKFVPGAMVLGALASQSYPQAQTQGLAWDLFHSGAVSFGDAKPITDQEQAPAIHTPLSIHHPKRSAEETRTYVDFTRKVPAQRLSQAFSDEQGVQFELTGSMVSSQGYMVKGSSSYALKTAIEFKSQRAKEGMLFGHSFLPAQTRLGFTVMIDEQHDQADQLKQFISTHLVGRHLIGKSRSAEFGSVDIKPVQTQANDAWAISEGSLPASWQACLKEHPSKSNQKILSILLLSETSLFDSVSGEVTLVPSPEQFMLDERFTYEPEYSFMRSTKWIPFNGYRKRNDMQRVALRAGSVISFSASEADWSSLSLETLLAAWSMGIGGFTNEGMGRISINHPSLQGDSWIKPKPKKQKQESLDMPALPKGPLMSWLLVQQEQKLYDDLALDIALELMKPDESQYQVHKLVKRSKPSINQWRNLEKTARRFMHKANGRQALFKVLFTGHSGSDAQESRSFGTLIRGKSKDEWKLTSDSLRDRSELFNDKDKHNLPIKQAISARPGNAILAMMDQRFYQAFPNQIERLNQVTKQRMAQESQSTSAEQCNEAMFERLIPLVITHVARMIARQKQ